ncbi:hypothetical protein L6164_020690 [Bauhinia variegata]|nr:hypothetical protein L6164_020690 [Bauhinia variegata]
MESSTIMEEDHVAHQAVPPTLPLSNLNNHHGYGALKFPMKTLAPVVVAAGGEKPIENLTMGPRVSPKPIRPTPIMPAVPVPIPIPIPSSSKMANLNLKEKSPIEPLPLSLKPPTTPNEQSPTASSSASSAFQAMSGKFSGSGDNIISVA